MKKCTSTQIRHRIKTADKVNDNDCIVTIQCFAGKPWFLSGFCILLRHVSLSSILLQTNQTAHENFTLQWRWKHLRSTIFKGPDPDSKPPSSIWHLLDVLEQARSMEAPFLKLTGALQAIACDTVPNTTQQVRAVSVPQG